MKKNISSNDITSEELEKLYKFSPAFSTEAACQLNKFSKSGFADRKLYSEVKTGEEQKFWANHAEALVFEFLTTLNFKLVQNTREAGPDFEIDLKESSSESSPQKLWVEVICPSPKDLPDDWLNGTGSPPLDKLLLKTTAAIKEKTEKFKGYLDKKIIQPKADSKLKCNTHKIFEEYKRKLLNSSRQPMHIEKKQIAVIGAGWAGLSAALSLQRQGHHVTLYDRAPASCDDYQGAGGRASTAYAVGEKAPFALDNGQHVLLGAYTETLALFKSLGIDTEQVFLRLPAAWHVPQGLSIVLPAWGDSQQSQGLWASSPLKQLPLAVALFKATPLREWAALATAALRLHILKPHQAETVVQWIGRLKFPTIFNEQLWLPLCYATLNTPPERASAVVFKRVIQDGLLAGSYNAAMLVPRTDLGALLPARALQQLAAQGAALRLGTTVLGVATNMTDVTVVSGDDSSVYDAVVCATTAKDAARIMPPSSVCPALLALSKQAPEPITTVHLNVGSGIKLPNAVMILPEPAQADNPIQHAVVIDRSTLDAAQAGWLTVVLSCSSIALNHSKEDLIAAALQRLRDCFPTLKLPTACEGVVIHAKQATFACKSNMARPGAQRRDARIVVAGDYVAGVYPATLEGAVRSAKVAAELLETPLWRL
jgi:hydroxysqualene dehydroxylase